MKYEFKSNVLSKSGFLKLDNGQHYIYGLHGKDKVGWPSYRFFYYRENAVKHRANEEGLGKEWKPINKYNWSSIIASYNQEEFTGEGYPIFI
jgi:hypothetical protein